MDLNHNLPLDIPHKEEWHLPHPIFRMLYNTNPLSSLDPDMHGRVY